jgi:hypothetical protein
MPDGERLIDLLRTTLSLPRVTPSLADRVAEQSQAICPQCKATFLRGALADHLVAGHGYLRISGTLLPRPAALACLWDRVFTSGDVPAHEQLLHILSGPQEPESDRRSYVQALEAELLRRAKTRLFTQPQELRRLVRHLRAARAPRQQFWQLLGSGDHRIRALGQELLLPDSAHALGEGETSLVAVQAWLDRLCPSNDVWAKIRLCQRLPSYGVDGTAVRECLRDLQSRRPVACPDCGAAVPQSELDEHVRQEHRQSVAQAVSVEDTIAALIRQVLQPTPDFPAWEHLESLAERECGAEAYSFLAVRVCQEMALMAPNQRHRVEKSVAELISAGTSGPKITLLLASSSEPVARCLALNIVPRLPPPLSTNLVRATRPLLLRKRAPGRAQVAAAAALLFTTGKEGRAASKVVAALIARCHKRRALDRLLRLERQVGVAPAITERATEIENQIHLRCPRCKNELARPEMARHLWLEHALVLDGRRVRKPWRMIKDWIKDYKAGGNAELLVRCRTLGTYLDPETGLLRVHRLVLAHRIEDMEARQILLEEARQQTASLCPRCFALVPARAAVVPRALNESHGRLSLEGYRAEVSERGLVSRLVLESPAGRIYDGPEPGRWLTRKGATLLLAGPFVVLALALAIALPYWQIRPHAGVAASLWAAAMVYLTLSTYWRTRPDVLDRAVDRAWTGLTPTLHQREFVLEDARFAASLAFTSTNHGRPILRAGLLKELIDRTDRAVASNSAPVAYLAPLRRLEVADLAASGGDPFVTLVKELARTFSGELPLAYAQWLLERWVEAAWFERGRDRLRVLVCDAAFEAGLEVRGLIDAGRVAPALGEILRVDEPRGLAELRLLWSWRAQAPWERWSKAITVFELANEGEYGRALLAKYPDLLLLDPDIPPVFLRGRGLVFQERLFTEQGRVEKKVRRDFNKTDYELVVNGTRLPFTADPTAIFSRLDRWFRYHFNEFSPQVEPVYSWPPPPGSKPLHFEEPAACPECGRLLVTRAGDVGVLLGGRQQSTGRRRTKTS